MVEVVGAKEDVSSVLFIPEPTSENISSILDSGSSMLLTVLISIITA